MIKKNVNELVSRNLNPQRGLKWRRYVCMVGAHAFLALGIMGCSGGPFSEGRLSKALQVGKTHNMTTEWVTQGPFTLLTQVHRHNPQTPLRVYIEGDGFAWVTRSRPSPDPTPRTPLALYLAEQDIRANTAQNIAWIARPCQYIMLSDPKQRCAKKYWTSSRLAPEVIEALDAAVSDLKRRTQASTVELVGYSGGGGAAVLVAARRTDVVRLRTVAGNIDLGAFVRQHRVSSMQGSLNPLSVVSKVAHIPQLHFVGAKDKIVPPIVSETFVQKVGRAARRIIVPDVDHGRRWIASWPRLLDIPFPHPKLPSVKKSGPAE